MTNIKIYDTFVFANELDILEIRLNILNSVVDKFVLVEASKTQSLLNKPFYFEENKGRFEPFLDKIIHIKVEDFPNVGGWAMENHQRNCISRGIKQIVEFKNDDIIAISDVDEIWNPKMAASIKKEVFENIVVSANMDYFVFYLNLKTVAKSWIGTVFVSGDNFLKMSPQYLRNIKDSVHITNEKGWHFGYQGGKEKVWQKYLSCIEPLDKSKLPNKIVFFEEFDKRIKDGGTFIFSDNLNDKNIRLSKVEIAELPEYIKRNAEKYKEMFL